MKDCEKIHVFLRNIHTNIKEFGIDRFYENIKSNADEGTFKTKKGTFQNKLNPDYPTHKLNADELLIVLAALKKEERHISPFTELLALFDMTWEQKKSASRCTAGYHDVINCWMQTNKEYGDVQTAVKEALSDDMISPYELIDIKREIDEQVESLRKFRSVLEDAAGKKMV